MVTGDPPSASPSSSFTALASPYRDATAVAVTATPLVLGLAALLVLGLWIPAGLDAAIMHSVAAIG